MSPFQEDIVKILLDKVLLGIIAAAFGFYLSRLLEDYRTRNAYQLIVLRERVDAYRRLLELVTEHHAHVQGLLGVVNAVAEKYPEKISDEEAAPAYIYVERYKDFKQRIAPLMAYITPDVLKVLRAYLTETQKVSNVVKGDFSLGRPDAAQIDESFVEFVHGCALAITSDPFSQSSTQD